MHDSFSKSGVNSTRSIADWPAYFTKAIRHSQAAALNKAVT
jgi:hypothetical protein